MVLYNVGRGRCRGLRASRPRLARVRIQGIPREGAHYIVEVDASYEHLGCALLQQQ